MLQLNALIAGYETVGDHTEYIIQVNCSLIIERIKLLHVLSRSTVKWEAG